MQVPLMDLKAEYQQLQSEVLSAIEDAIGSMQLFLGPNVQALEAEWAQLCQIRHAVGVGSGTDGLIIALKALNIGPGDEVITVSWTFIATIEAIVHVGAQPVIVDIEPTYYCLDPARLEAALTPHTRAIIPVHIYGHPAEMASINQVAREHKLHVIEDAAQAHGAEYHGQPVGGLADCGIFSFYLSKNVGGYGEGGMIATNDDELARKLRLLRNHGCTSKYEHVLLGYNSRLDEIQAAILRVKLKRLQWGNQRRRKLAALYDELLTELPVTTPTVAEDGAHAYHLYTIRTPDRDALAAHLESQGISSAQHYKFPSHTQPACQPWGLNDLHLPETERAAQEVLQLPVHPYLADEQIIYVGQAVQRFFN